VQGQWLHVQRVEWKWRLVGSVDRQVGGGRAAIAYTGPASGRQLGALHTGWQLHVHRVERRWRLVGSGWQLGGGSRDRDAVRTRAGCGRYYSTGPGPIQCTVLFFQLFKLCSNFKIQNKDHSNVQNYCNLAWC
jgi:hypothetical protein